MKKIQFRTVEELQLAINLFAGIWFRNNSMDPDLDPLLLAEQSLTNYDIFTFYNEEHEKRVWTRKPFQFNWTDKELEEEVTEILDELSKIKLAA